MDTFPRINEHTLDIGNGYRFLVVSAPDDEVNGFIEAPKGGMVAGTSGWYRTTDPDEAARSAILAVERDVFLAIKGLSQDGAA